MIFFSVSILRCILREIFLRCSRRSLSSSAFHRPLMLVLSPVHLCDRVVGKKISEQHNSFALLSICWPMLYNRTPAQNGSEEIVCLWFSFERVWSFFYSRIKTLWRTLMTRIRFAEGKRNETNKNFIFLSDVFCDKPPVFLFHDAQHLVFLSFFLITSRRGLRIDRNPIWFPVFYCSDGNFIFCDFGYELF